jgi:steroid 5-alpha reductase family enzyme
VFYLFHIQATGIVFHPTILGCILLLVLFSESAKFSEGITLKKYEAYADYVKQLPVFVPIGNYKLKGN